jgi:methylenetetrahydrofolate dehydrogenase (NADP+) / methenyltetrahydrofolate cyclohydrolase
LNRDDSVDAILLQLPLPAGFDPVKMTNLIDPDKDVDAFTFRSIGALWSGAQAVAPCTPAGIVRLLQVYQIPIEGRHAVIIGRSNIVGKPLAALMLAQHATVTLCHSRTRDLERICQSAEILVAAIGKPAFITSRHIPAGAIVVDVGMNRILRRDADPGWLALSRPSTNPSDTFLIGDVDPVDMNRLASRYTPVPGGIGPMTIAFLLQNTLTLAKRRARVIE